MNFKPIIGLEDTYLIGEFIHEWFSLNDAAKALSINVGNISNVLTGRQKSAGGYRWERV